MSERTLKRILAGVGVLVVAYLALTLFRGPAGSTGDDDGGPVADLLADLDPESVQELRFARSTDTIRLTRSDGSWSVNGRAADSARVARFWSDLSEARVSGPIARNPSNHARLGVAAESTARVAFRTANGEERQILVGEAGPSRPSAYVRLPDRDPVHVVHADLRGAVQRDPESWRDRTVVRVDTARVRTIELGRESGDLALSRDDGAWSVDGTEADTAAVEGILGALANLRATGFASDTTDLGPVDRTLVALDEAGDTLTVLSLADGDEPGSRVQARGDSTIYELTRYEADRLFPGADALRGDAGEEG